MKKEDRVDKAIKERMAAGNFLTVVPNAETHQAMARVLNLKLAGDYNIKENAKNKEMQKFLKREMQPPIPKAKRSHVSPMRVMNLDKVNK